MKYRLTLLISFMAAVFVLLPARVSAEATLPDGVVVSNGWVSGEFTTIEGGIFLVDMPVPVVTVPNEKLTVEYRQFKEEEVRSALRAAGQSGEGHISLYHVSNPDSFFAFEGDYDAESSAEITREEAQAQAVATAIAFFDALGLDYKRDSPSVSRPYEYDDSKLPFWHTMSEPEALSAYLRAFFNSPKHVQARPKQQAYTCVSFEILLNGLPMDGHTGYRVDDPIEPDIIENVPAIATVTVSDRGEIVYAMAEHIPIAFSRESTDPLMDWQEYLSYYQYNPVSPEDQAERIYFDVRIGMEVTEYAQFTVFTGLSLIYQPVSHDEWVPVWATSTSTYVPYNGWCSEPNTRYWIPYCLDPWWQ